jgi:hypothetical protein
MNVIHRLFLSVAMMIGTLQGTVSAYANDFPRVDADLAQYDATAQKMTAEFGALPADPGNKDWVIKKLQCMVDVDQYMRRFPEVIYTRQYTADEKTDFYQKFGPRWQKLDSQNTADLRELLKLYSWFTVSEFGQVSDQNAWLLVQHADMNPDFQREILLKLEALYPKGETKAANYAYLYDRVAASWQDPSKRTLQRFGTQGTCVGPGKWEPLPVEDPANLDVRRASVGLRPESEYIAGFLDICR